MYSIVCYAFVVISFLSVEEGSRPDRALSRAIRSGYYHSFNGFYKKFANLSNDEKARFVLDTNNVNMLLSFQRDKMLCGASDSLFFLQLQLNDILDGEMQEIALQRFSEFFYKHLAKSLLTCEKIKDEGRLREIISAALFDEAIGEKIWSYIHERRLTSKDYYHLFAEHFTSE